MYNFETTKRLGEKFQWKKALALICKVRISDPEDSIKKSMDFFLGFLSQCKIEFTAFGLATIDRGLMLGVRTTILLSVVHSLCCRLLEPLLRIW